MPHSTLAFHAFREKQSGKGAIKPGSGAIQACLDILRKELHRPNPHHALPNQPQCLKAIAALLKGGAISAISHRIKNIDGPCFTMGHHKSDFIACRNKLTEALKPFHDQHLPESNAVYDLSGFARMDYFQLGELVTPVMRALCCSPRDIAHQNHSLHIAELVIKIIFDSSLSREDKSSQIGYLLKDDVLYEIQHQKKPFELTEGMHHPGNIRAEIRLLQIKLTGITFSDTACSRLFNQWKEDSEERRELDTNKSFKEITDANL
jgi:hypothetical protein